MTKKEMRACAGCVLRQRGMEEWWSGKEKEKAIKVQVQFECELHLSSATRQKRVAIKRIER